MTKFATGPRPVIQHKELLFRCVDPSADVGCLISREGISQLVRWKAVLFLTSVYDCIEILDPHHVTRTFTAPFARTNREEGYRTAWAFF